MSRAERGEQLAVVGGGTPTDEELAALVVALTPVSGVPAGGNGDELLSRPDQVPAWARAALLEGVGGRRPTRPSDLRGFRGHA